MYTLYHKSVYFYNITNKQLKTNKMTIFSNRGETTKVKGQFFVSYSAVNIYGKKYTTTHLNPVGCKNSNLEITADELQNQWAKRYFGKCPFNGDSDFKIIKLQQRNNSTFPETLF